MSSRDKGHAEAHYRLGVMYNSGRGVPQSYVNAVVHYDLAGSLMPRSNPKELARQQAVFITRDMLARKLSSAELSEAKLEVGDWWRAHPDLYRKAKSLGLH